MISRAGATYEMAERACSSVTPGPARVVPTVMHSSFSNPGRISEAQSKAVPVDRCPLRPSLST
jgi:hypothetical protein